MVAESDLSSLPRDKSPMKSTAGEVAEWLKAAVC
jgi:hypothetical protein